MLHVLRTLKYKNTCELCDNIIDEEKTEIIMVKISFVIHEEVIDVINEKINITTIEKLSFHIAHVRIIGSMEFGNTRNDCFHDNSLKKI